jgi:putative thiamine transport system substrate-binding protein
MAIEIPCQSPDRGNRPSVLVIICFFALAGILLGCGRTGEPPVAEAPLSWAEVVGRAGGQTVYWNAWGGDTLINGYISWVADEVRSRYGIRLRHVKTGDTAESVGRLLAEKAAGRNTGGSMDMIWINGENFAALKENGLLYGPFVSRLPNYGYADVEGLPLEVDFTVPVDGLEAPWTMGRFIFLFDSGYIDSPPRDPEALLSWARENPGRLTYPQPPDFTGSTFLKQLLVSLSPEGPWSMDPGNVSDFKVSTAVLWDFLDRLHPHLWRSGRAFPPNGPAMTRMLADGEIHIAMSFNAEAARSGILRGELPQSISTFNFESGSIANASFLAIPYNARSPEGAMVVINFLLSAEAQARKMDPQVIGGTTVLALDKMPPEERQFFDRLPSSADPESRRAHLSGISISEPHPGWMELIEKEWIRRYGGGG